MKNKSEELNAFFASLSFAVRFVVLIWGVKIFEGLLDQDFTSWGLLPRTLSGLKGILFFPLLHADFNHLLSNTLPLIILGTGIFYFYPQSSKKAAVMIYIIPGIITWIIGRQHYHIGASGIIYGLVAFIFFSGVIRRDTRSIALALLVTFLYGSLAWGILPLDEKTSWEGHLSGAVTGIAAAFIFRKSDPYERYKWDDEDDEPPDANDGDTKE